MGPPLSIAPEPLKDGLLILRYLFGFREANLTTGVVDAVNGKRTSAAAIQNFLSLYDLDPLTNPVSTTAELSAVSAQLSAPSETSELSAQASGEGQGAMGTTESTPSPLASSPSPAGSLSTQDSALPSAVAAVQLSSTSLQSQIWVADFLGVKEDEDELVVLL